MTATIIPLPSAAASPVIQFKRRGRFPKMVVSIWQLRADSARLRRSNELLEMARDYRERAASIQDTANYALSQAAIWEAQALAVRTLRR
jgi:hypothetical protein